MSDFDWKPNGYYAESTADEPEAESAAGDRRLDRGRPARAAPSSTRRPRREARRRGSDTEPTPNACAEASPRAEVSGRDSRLPSTSPSRTRTTPTA